MFQYEISFDTNKSTAPEAVSYVFKRIVRRTAVEPLVCSLVFQAAEMFQIGSYLYIFEIVSVNFRRYSYAPTIPCDMISWIVSVYVSSQCVYLLWFGITTHKRDTCYIATIRRYNFCQR